MEREENEHLIKNLEELGSSDFEIRDGQPHIIGWKVLNSARQYLGTVSELLFEPAAQKVRYLVLNLEHNIWEMEERDVLIPIGVAELDLPHNFVILPHITAQQITVLPDYHKGHTVISGDPERYGHQDFQEPAGYAARVHGSYQDHLPFEVVTRIFQEESDAEHAFVLLVENGFKETDLKVTPYNPLNSVTDLQGNTNTEFIGDGSRDEYILSVTASSAGEAALAKRLLDIR